MKRRICRILAFAMALVLVLGMLPVSAMKESDTYNIWVGGTQITTANRNDVLGDGGSVRYEPGTEHSMSTLTLTNAHIAGAAVPAAPPDNNYGIFCNNTSFNLVLVGDSTVAGKDAADMSAGIYDKNGYILVTGDGTLTARGGTAMSSCGVYSTDLTIVSGTVSAYGGKGSDASAGVVGDTLNMMGGVLTAAGGEAPDSQGIYISSVTVRGGTMEAVGQTLALDAKPDFKNTDSTVEVNDAASAAGAAEWDEKFDLGGSGSIYKYVKITCSYGLWVQGTKVTDANKNDVLGDGGSVRYTPVSSTEPAKLTLKNAHITGAKSPYDEEDTAAVYCMGTLMLELVGNSTITGSDAADESYGIHASAEFGITGDGTLNVTSGNAEESCAIYAAELYMMGGTVSAASGYAKMESEAVRTYGFEMYSGSLTAVGGSAMGSAGIGGSAVKMHGGKITATGGTLALYSEPEISDLFDEKVKVNTEASASGASDWDKTSPLGGFHSFKYVSIRADYGVWVQGIQVTADNQNDVLGDGGSVKYDPVPHNGPPKLTLKNARITGGPCPDDDEDTAGIFIWEDTTLELVGNSTITGTDAVDDSYGIVADQDLWITGDGKLTVKPGEGYYSYGISVNDLRMLGGTVHAESNAGIYEDDGVSAHEFYMEGGVLEAVGGKAPDSFGVWCSDIRITGGIFTASGGSAALQSDPDVSDFPDAVVRVNTEAKADGAAVWDGTSALGGSDTVYKYVSVAPVNPFVDVKKGAFYYDPVLWAVGHDPQITKGTDATHFSPNATCTRGQVVTFLWRAAGCPEPTKTDNPFTDVKAGAFYYKAVLWAVENGITKGTGAATFSPNQGCTRGQVVTFLYRFAGSPKPGSTEQPFVDIKAGAFYYDAVLWAVKNEITKGTDDTHFSPNATCTRGQIVTFLYRAAK